MAGLRHLALTLLVLPMMLAFSAPMTLAQSGVRATEFKLANGLHVVVIPDNRAPVVTHMAWYRVGAADEPAGHSGIAHFLEHLMFKATEKLPSGEFSKTVARLGGQDNAFTSQDATAYHQQIAKERLEQLMAMEADRMVNLRLAEAEVLTERDVIIEERRSRIENNPGSILDEQMNQALHPNHTYGVPVIGFMHEMAQLSRADALGFYKQHYAPNNAILVVSGDVTVDEVKAMAERTYGKVATGPQIAVRARPSDPPPLAPRRIDYVDARAGKPVLRRYYTAPSYVTAAKGEAEALDLLLKIASSGSTSRLYRRLVVEQKIASNAGGYYQASGLDSGKIALYAVPADGHTLDDVERALDAVLEEIRKGGVTEAELDRARKSYIADYVYESDSQVALARRYGWGLVVGQTVADVESWPADLAKVTTADVKAVADRWLDIKRSVTGRLLPEAAAAAAKPANQQAPANRS